MVNGKKILREREFNPVLIVGSGFAGLSTACFLAKQNIKSTVIERRASTSVQPKARGISARTMELLALLDLEEGILAQDESRTRTRRTALMEDFTQQLQDFGKTPPDTANISSSAWGMISQENLERMLVARALSLGVRVDFESNLTEIWKGDNGITVMVEDRKTGFSRLVDSSWIVGADGPRSFLRESMDIATDGRGDISTYIRIVFSADLLDTIEAEEVLFFIRHPKRGLGTLHSTDIRGRYVLSMEVPKASERYTEDRTFAEELVREVSGIDDLEVGVGEVTSWTMAERIPRSLRDGRLLLAGDAAHIIPSVGGFGGNSAIQDGAELAWRLAEVVEGTDSVKALDQYSNERRSFARFVAQQAFGYYANRQAWHLKAEICGETAPYITSVFGFGMRGSSRWSNQDVQVEDVCWEDPGDPSGQVGYRAPHRLFRTSRGTLGTSQLAGYRYLALLGQHAHGWREFLENPPMKAPGIQVQQLGVEVTDVTHGGPAPVVSRTGALIVRPDGYVALRSESDMGRPPEKIFDSFGSFLRSMQGGS
ncbi:FAD-dependent monooxygenase [Nocardiopsis xinjiangensis]|uniref:FAD-dependent monooxygenase n=1 Tax=Nocardiopsis xinjiangensis TaxID=124285 RepID=UPI000A00A1B4|nr:FAD-dependent monooxygenase [Nocardiopsis xinjiangensis]